jgi:aconitate hydratase
VHLTSGERLSIYDAAMRYARDQTPLVVLAGKEYGTGSSRDWAAKGTQLLGVRAVIAESFERIHRSNLVGFGVLPLQFKEGENAISLGLSGREFFSIRNIEKTLQPGVVLTVEASDETRVHRFEVRCRIDTVTELYYYRNGGILHYVLRTLLES